MNKSEQSLLKVALAFAIAMLLLFTLSVNAKATNSLLPLKQQWATANYQLSDEQQEQAFEELLKKAKQTVENEEKNAENWIWLGIIQSSYAGVKGGLGALSLAKAAKKSLENALSIDEQALSGAAYTSLGALFHKVPGWPIGFGDDKKAKKYLEKSVAMNPQGIDANYFLAEMLYDKRKYKAAKRYLTHAANAKPRENRPIADKFRQQEISQLMAKLNKKLD